MNNRNHLESMEGHTSFSHLRTRMMQEKRPPEAAFERLSTLRKRAALSRTAAVLREIVENIGKK